MDLAFPRKRGVWEELLRHYSPWEEAWQPLGLPGSLQDEECGRWTQSYGWTHCLVSKDLLGLEDKEFQLKVLSSAGTYVCAGNTPVGFVYLFSPLPSQLGGLDVRAAGI